jgi:ABC-type sugar transport system substrate-binding protein
MAIVCASRAGDAARLSSVATVLSVYPRGDDQPSAKGNAAEQTNRLMEETIMSNKRSIAFKRAIGAAFVSLLALSGAQAADGAKVAVDLTTLTSPFWTAYNKYIVNEAKAQGLDLLQPFNSEFDTAKQITGVKNSIALGAKGIIFSPFDTSAAGTVLNLAEKAKVAVVAVDVAPDKGPVAIVVRANNVAYGEQACHYIGDHVPEGPVVQIMGDQASINGRDRGNGFRDCVKKNYPKLKLLEIPTKAWSGEDAATGLDTVLNSTPDLKAIYMHASKPSARAKPTRPCRNRRISTPNTD